MGESTGMEPEARRRRGAEGDVDVAGAWNWGAQKPRASSEEPGSLLWRKGRGAEGGSRSQSKETEPEALRRAASAENCEGVVRKEHGRGPGAGK
ncbi:hypothetical protein NDU88_004579 [Pleurodeles waltl]|uniref:Uncharacterized protein n=1 Tax=Pleurodeles waltl TaxID=8319 RepID=A0AAV7PCX7_PLEWA|nr:hypothetical protein NDU88_004579 [Pleurodeles waltl]